MNYFKSAYKRCTYSPGWYGTLDWAPPATVLLYNDNDCWCIGYMESDLPNGVVAITEAEANEILAAAEALEATEDVWFGEKLENRWNEEAVSNESEPDIISEDADIPDVKQLIKTSFKFCPHCGKKTAKIDAFDDLSFDIWQGTNKLMSGVKAMSINLTCPDGHKVKVTLSNG